MKKLDDILVFDTYLYRSPAGGWWSRPSNWKSNTAVAAIGMAVTLGFVWNVSAKKEVNLKII